MSSFTEDNLFSVRIVTADSCLMKPVTGIDVNHSEFRQHNIDLVPIIRIFGSTPSGQSTCLYVHGIFPYLLIPYHGLEITEPNREQVERSLRQTAESLETALNGTSPKQRQRVFKISLVTATPFYGFHNSEDFFMKIFFYYPTDIKRAADILLAGGVMERPFQPHEAHIPFVLQSSIDYNLHGMNLLHSANCWFRSPLGKPTAPVVLRCLDDEEKSTNKPSSSSTTATSQDNKQAQTVASNVNLQNFDWNLMRNEGANVALCTQNTSDPNISQPTHDASNSTSTQSTQPKEIPENFQSTYCTPKCQSIVSKILSQSTTSPTPPSGDNYCPIHRVWSSATTDHILPSSVAERQSTCELEVDIIAADIINRNELKCSDVTNPGIAAIWADEIARRGQEIKKNPTQKRENVAPMTAREANYLQMLYDALDEHQASNISVDSLLDKSNTDLFHCSQANDLEVLSQTQVLSQHSEGTPILSQPTQLLDKLTPIVSQDIISQVLSSEKDFDEEVANLSVVSQHSNGFYDVEEIPLNQLTKIAADDDELETIEMSQRWDCEEIMPQYDGANDDTCPEATICDEISNEDVEATLKYILNKVVTNLENNAGENIEPVVQISQGDIKPVTVSLTQGLQSKMGPAWSRNVRANSCSSNARPKLCKIVGENFQIDSNEKNNILLNPSEPASTEYVDYRVIPPTAEEQIIITQPCDRKVTEPEFENESSEISYSMRLRQTRQSSDITNTIPASLLLASDSDSDCDFDISHALHVIKPPPKRSRRKKKKQKVIIKWIITNRFKGSSSMLVKLWKIPAVSTVPISNELLEMLELYSPKKLHLVAGATGKPKLSNVLTSFPNTSASQSLQVNTSSSVINIAEDYGANNSSAYENLNGTNFASTCKSVATTSIASVSTFTNCVASNISLHPDCATPSVPSKTVEYVSLSTTVTMPACVKWYNVPPPIPEKLLRRQIGKRSKQNYISDDDVTVTTSSDNHEPILLLDSDNLSESLLVKTAQTSTNKPSLPAVDLARTMSKENLESSDHISSNLLSANAAGTILTTPDVSVCKTEQKKANEALNELSNNLEIMNTDTTVPITFAIESKNVQCTPFTDKVNKTSNHLINIIPIVQEMVNEKPQFSCVNTNNNNSHESEAENSDSNTYQENVTDLKMPEKLINQPNMNQSTNDMNSNIPQIMNENVLEDMVETGDLEASEQTITTIETETCKVIQQSNDSEVFDQENEMNINNNVAATPVEKINCKIITEALATCACKTLDVKIMERIRMREKAKKVVAKKHKRDGPNIMPVSNRTLEPCVRLEQLKQSDLNGMGVNAAIKPSMHRKYLPTRKVTRRSVSVKLKALSAPTCMFPDPQLDDCFDVSILNNALYTLAFNSPIGSPIRDAQSPPRAWSPINDAIATSSRRNNSSIADHTTLLNQFASSFENSHMLSSIDPDQMIGVNLDEIIAEESVQVELEKVNKIKSEITSNFLSRPSSMTNQKTDLEIEEEAILQMFSDIPPTSLPSPAESSNISAVDETVLSPPVISVKGEVAPEPFVKLKQTTTSDGRNADTPWPDQNFSPTPAFVSSKPEFDIPFPQNKPFSQNYFDSRFHSQNSSFKTNKDVLHKDIYKGTYSQPAFDQKLYNDNFVNPVDPVPVQVFHTHVHHHHHVHSIDKPLQKQSEWQQSKPPEGQWSAYTTPSQNVPHTNNLYTSQPPFTASNTPQFSQPYQKFNPSNIPESNFSILMKKSCTNFTVKNKKRKSTSKKPKSKKSNKPVVIKQPGPVNKKVKSPYAMLSKQKVLSKRIKVSDPNPARSPPPDTPTISLTNKSTGTNPVPALPLSTKKGGQKSDDVYAMYDLDIENPSQADNKGSLFKVILADSQSQKDKSDDSTLQTFSFPIQDEENNKKTLTGPPVVKKGEELVLNCVTGEWEVKKIANEEVLPDINFDESLPSENNSKSKESEGKLLDEAAPEYEIAAVDMNSKLPKLKLKLKRSNANVDKTQVKRSKLPEETAEKNPILLRIKQNKICSENSDESVCSNSPTVDSDTHSDSTESASECESEHDTDKYNIDKFNQDKNYNILKTLEPDSVAEAVTATEVLETLSHDNASFAVSSLDTLKPPIKKVCLSKNPCSQRYEVMQAPKDHKAPAVQKVGSTSKTDDSDCNEEKNSDSNCFNRNKKQDSFDESLPPNPDASAKPVEAQHKKVSFKVSTKPPSREEVEAYAAENNQTHSVPFYSNPADAMAQKSNRLMDGLPYYVHKPQAMQKLKNYKEYESVASRAGSLNHWRVVLTAEKNPEMLDQVLQIPESDFAAKISLENVGNITLKVAKMPPSQKEVQDWLEDQKTGKKFSYKPETPKPSANKKTLEIAATPKLQKSLSLQPVLHKLKVKRRRVSFDLSNLITESPTSTVMDLSPVKNDNLSIHAPNPKGLISTPSTFTNVAFQSTPKSMKKLVKHTSIKYDRDSLITDQHTPTSSHVPKIYSKRTDVTLQTPQSCKKQEGSQVEGPSLDNTFGFKAKQENLGEAKAVNEVQHLTVVSMELHVQTRINLCPDPEIDPIQCIFYCMTKDVDYHKMLTGCFIVESKNQTRPLLHRCGVTTTEVKYVSNELMLLQQFVAFIRKLDPDILTGYEVQMLSWGYLLQRGQCLRVDVCGALSRIPTDRYGNRSDATKDVFGADNAHELHVVGRIILNIWRLMRTEVALYDYSFENVAFHVLHERYSRHNFKTLSNWYNPPAREGTFPSMHRTRRVIDYYVSRVRGQLRMLTQQDLIGRTSELSRLFGILFYDVLTRGSQFRVESMLLRAAKSRNLVAVTSSKFQRAQMVAPECIALVMEPESRFYHHPLVVLDFQSLYPSIVIAYNLCYSTCLGKVEHLGSNNKFTFGCTSLCVSRKKLRKLLQNNQISIMPNGVAYVKSCVRSGVMPDMLKEILDTRIMVKESMKSCSDGTTKRMLDHRQLGLKLIANVTYGYTAAHYSGRMPCVELGVSIVHKSRETLERAISMVKRNAKKWEGARIVYGDTDSMFIEFPGVKGQGCSKERAFEVGREIAKVVTEDNPPPVKLKFEKVYLPCILQTKKRYVGYSYESEDQTEPIFDAKGIETVRRDGCPATSKILEKSLRLLFESKDVSKVKSYVMEQCSKVLNSESIAQDCVMAKEYRGMEYYRPGAVVPSLIIARKQLAMDRRSEPRVGERVPYLVRHGAPGTALYQLVTTLHEYMHDDSIRLNGVYYVTKQILPALDRMMSLLGEDVFQWYVKIPRIIHHKITLMQQSNTYKKGATLSQFFRSKHCILCRALCKDTLCAECVSHRNVQRTMTQLQCKMRQHERKLLNINKICISCTDCSDVDIKCTAYNCPLTFRRKRVEALKPQMDVIQHALLSNNLS